MGRKVSFQRPGRSEVFEVTVRAHQVRFSLGGVGGSPALQLPGQDTNRAERIEFAPGVACYPPPPATATAIGTGTRYERVKEVLRTNNPVELSWAIATLRDAGIAVEEFDRHTSTIEGSIGAIQRRIVVADKDHAYAVEVLETSRRELEATPPEDDEAE